MIYWFLMHCLQLILDLFALSRLSDREKDADILLLRYQLRLATREIKRGPVLPLWHKLPLAVLANRLVRMARGARHKLALDALLFTPDTLIMWHRALVRRKWTHKPKRKPGRPRKDPDLEALVVRMKREKHAGATTRSRVNSSSLVSTSTGLPSATSSSGMGLCPRRITPTAPGVRLLYRPDLVAENLVRPVLH